MFWREAITVAILKHDMFFTDNGPLIFWKTSETTWNGKEIISYGDIATSRYECFVRIEQNRICCG